MGADASESGGRYQHPNGAGTGDAPGQQAKQ